MGFRIYFHKHSNVGVCWIHNQLSPLEYNDSTLTIFRHVSPMEYNDSTLTIFRHVSPIEYNDSTLTIFRHVSPMEYNDSTLTIFRHVSPMEYNDSTLTIFRHVEFELLHSYNVVSLSKKLSLHCWQYWLVPGTDSSMFYISSIAWFHNQIV